MSNVVFRALNKVCVLFRDGSTTVQYLWVF